MLVQDGPIKKNCCIKICEQAETYKIRKSLQDFCLFKCYSHVCDFLNYPQNTGPQNTALSRKQKFLLKFGSLKKISER